MRRIFGVDFTSAPSARKPIRVAACDLDGERLVLLAVEAIPTLAAFEDWLAVPGPWVAALDLPFMLPSRVVRALGWPEEWGAFAERVGSMDRAAWRTALESYKEGRAPGDREHPRAFEAGTGAVSAQKLHGVPVALMLHAAVPRLRAAGVDLPGLLRGDPERVAMEAYPGVAARALIGRRPYKSDERSRQTPERAAARRDILAALTGEGGRLRFGLRVEAPDWVAEDPTGDALDALLAAVQAAWGWRWLRTHSLPPVPEGWIADPYVVERL